MIKVVDGNLLDATENLICHQTNCQGVMGSGVAKAIKDKYPEVFIAYKDYCKQSKSQDLLGKAQLVKINETQHIVNLFGQQNFGNPFANKKQFTSLEALEESLKRTYKFAKENRYTVAIPWKMGSCRGGGNWEDVYKLIEQVFKDVNVTLYRLDLG